LKNSIATRLITLLSLCSVLILSVGTLLDYRLSRQQILQRLQADSQETIRAAIIDMENWLDGVEGATLFLARILEQRNYSPEGLEQMLKDIVENNPDIYGSTIALNPDLAETAQGFAPYYYHNKGVLTYADLSSKDYDYQQQAWFRDAVTAGKPVWVEPYFDRGGGEILMTTFSVPVFRIDNEGHRYLYAVVTADVALDELRAYLRRLRVGESGFATLLSRSGIILGSRNESHIMRHYADLGSDKVDLPTWRTMFQSALRSETTSRQLECPEIPGRCVIRMDALESTGWPVAVVYSEHEITAPLRDFQARTVIIGITTLLLMAVAVYLVTRRLTRPITSLAQAADGFARGNLQTPLPRVRGNDEIARLVRSFAAMRKDLTQHIADLEIATASRSRLEGELAAAREIQMSLLPRGGEALEENERYKLWARVRPAKTVGGDLYTYHQSGDRIFFAVGDVSDKGIPAALFMARATSLLQHLLTAGETPSSAMAQLNDELETGNDNCMFVTLFLAELDLTTLRMRFASAGHTPPGLVRGGRVALLQQDDGPALGLASHLEFPTNVTQLEPGDRLAVFTDGIDEAFNAAGEMFGTERFLNRLGETADLALADTGDLLFKAVDGHIGANPQSDDITVVLLEVVGGEENSQRFSLNFHAGSGLATRVMAQLQGRLEASGLPSDTVTRLVLVVEELSTNIEKYAALPENSELGVDVSISAAEISMEFSDQGKPFNPLTESKRSHLGADIESAEIGGLGVHLITQLTDKQSYRYEGGYNRLRIGINLDPGDT
jgi:sigma-B regulation protein RsbU (phosphoserine phosphatase)